MAMVLALPVRQRALAGALAALTLVEEDRQRSHQRQIPCGGGLTDLAMVFALRVISPVMLLGLDPPSSRAPAPTRRLDRLRRGTN